MDDIIFESRHSKEKHERDLREANARHDLVRERAIQVIQISVLEYEANRANQIIRNAQTILELETQKAESDRRLREVENARRAIPPPSPRIPTPPPQVAPVVETPAPTPTPPQPKIVIQSPHPPPPAVQSTQVPPPPVLQPTAPVAQAFARAEPTHQFQAAQPVSQPSPPTIQPVAPPRIEIPKTAVVDPRVTALQQIHIQCKNLRRHVATLPKEIKNEAGQMRRKIKMTLGQLTSESNKTQIENLRIIFNRALTITSHNADPRIFLLQKEAPPAAEAKHNGEEMPIIFLYVMNIFSKAIIGQLINEASTRPEAAEPIGVIAHMIFSQADFQWRNCSFIDILIAKYHRSCPILFGATGNERTEAGRMAIGWKHDRIAPVPPAQNPTMKPVPPAVHSSAMAGLAIGYAALTLRNYSKTVRQNPYSPHYYWTAIATITSTDPGRVCPSQFTVLKGLIENHHDKFVAFYGDQALAALRVAVVSFPAATKETNIEVQSLQVLADKWGSEGFYIT